MRRMLLFSFLILIASQVIGSTRILIGTGITQDGFDEAFEILDIGRHSSPWPTIEKFPVIQNQEVFSGVDPKGRRFICHFDCFYLEQDGTWSKMSEMKNKRIGAAGSRHPANRSLTLISGGKFESTILNSMELLDDAGIWQEYPAKLPSGQYLHCMVTLDAQRVMTIGGIFKQYDRTFIFDVENESWANGPSLQKKRWGHSCGRVKANSRGQKWSTIVVGGDIYQQGASTELLDDGATGWREGPALSNEGVHGGLLLEKQDGSVLLVSGRSGAGPYHLDTIYHLQHAEAEWTKLDVKVSKPRSYFVGWILEENADAAAPPISRMNWLILLVLAIQMANFV